ncbi:hypothetical protein MKQ70_28805 [Chitinophaga sedimenti]|uniref:hypothetical protein n=1 Tax=Chitinophaga sedimenti TaxID=2033606 RepID=UPI0020039F44|nr:hypothetical protein [Chitinophaga sedimenti]MCK7558770.1 hypothetical protein [Chitinophaga sedimenti]
MLSSKAILQSWAFHPFHKAPESSASDFTVMSFNCSMFGMREYKDNPELRLKMYDLLVEAKPDILCLQEFYSNEHPDRLHNVDSVIVRGGYPYHYFSKDFTRWDTGISARPFSPVSLLPMCKPLTCWADRKRKT